MSVNSYLTGHADQAMRIELSTLGAVSVTIRNLSLEYLIFAWNGLDASPTNGMRLNPEGRSPGPVMEFGPGLSSMPVPQVGGFSVRGPQANQAFEIDWD
jgi:hypothetical protein